MPLVGFGHQGLVLAQEHTSPVGVVNVNLPLQYQVEFILGMLMEDVCAFEAAEIGAVVIHMS